MEHLQASQADGGFPARLKALRLRAGYESQAALARACGYDQMTVHRHEQATRKPSPRSIQRYAEVLGVSPAYLQWGVGSETPNAPRAVLGYLSRHAVAEETRARLMRMPWPLLVDGDVTERHVAEVRRMLDRNLGIPASLPDGQTELPLGRRDVPQHAARS